MSVKVHPGWISIKDGIKYWYVWHDSTICLSAVKSYVDRYAQGWWKNRKETKEFYDKWMPESKWVTKEWVWQESKISDKAALGASIIHWRQIIVNGIEEFRKARRNDKVGIGTLHCALCQRHIHKGTCPLNNNCAGICSPLWKKADADLGKGKLDGAIELHNELVRLYNKESKMNDVDIRLDQNQKDMNRLKAEREEILKEKERKKKYVPQSNDVCINDWGEYRFLKQIEGKWWYVFDEQGSLLHQKRDDIDGVIKVNKYKKVGKLTGFKFE